MDQETKEYRELQFSRVKTVYSEFKPKIKIIKPDGETNWLDISEEELQKIKTVLAPETKTRYEKLGEDIFDYIVYHKEGEPAANTLIGDKALAVLSAVRNALRTINMEKLAKQVKPDLKGWKK